MQPLALWHTSFTRGLTHLFQQASQDAQLDGLLGLLSLGKVVVIMAAVEAGHVDGGVKVGGVLKGTARQSPAPGTEHEMALSVSDVSRRRLALEDTPVHDALAGQQATIPFGEYRCRVLRGASPDSSDRLRWFVLLLRNLQTAASSSCQDRQAICFLLQGCVGFAQ